MYAMIVVVLLHKMKETVTMWNCTSMSVEFLLVTLLYFVSQLIEILDPLTRSSEDGHNCLMTLPVFSFNWLTSKNKVN